MTTGHDKVGVFCISPQYKDIEYIAGLVAQERSFTYGKVPGVTVLARRCFYLNVEEFIVFTGYEIDTIIHYHAGNIVLPEEQFAHYRILSCFP